MATGAAPFSGLTIAGFGMVSSLGYDARSSCAAARAGIVRPRELPDFQQFDDDSGAPLPLTAHWIPDLTDGYAGIGRIVRLGVGAMRDLLRDAGMNGGRQERMGFYLALSGNPFVLKVARDEMAEVEPDIDKNLAEVERDRRARYAAAVPARIASVCGLSLQAAATEVFFADHAGFVQALFAAEATLRRGEVRRCIVGAIDSLADDDTLAALAALGLLKSPAQARALMPGEGAAFVLLESPEELKKRGGGRAEILAPAVQDRDEGGESRSAAPGDALVRVVQQSLGILPEGDPIGWIIGNLDGTESRALEWGMAQVRLPRPLLDLPQWTPVVSFGETGAATGPIAIGMGLAAMARGYAPRGTALVWLSSHEGAKAAFCLRGRRAGGNHG